MTFRLMGLPEELRLELEQGGYYPNTEEARLIIETSVQQAENLLDTALREIQTVIGPHGSVSRLQAGGVRIASDGIGVFSDGVLKTTILQDGNFLVGSNVSDPANTSMAVFVNEQIYNNEQMGAGDLLVGDNSAANMFYDASAGQLQFRNGSTVNVYIDTDGTLKAGAGAVIVDATGITFANTSGVLFFEDSDGNPTTRLFGNSNDDFMIQLDKIGGRIRFNVEPTSGGSHNVYILEDPDNPNVTQLDVGLGADGAKLTVGGGETTLWTGKDGQVTVFNDGGFDIDFRMESATNTNALKMDAGAEAISMFGVPGVDGTVITVDGGTDKRLEIGQDHYLPTRNASNPNVYFNEANQDMDTYIGTVNSDNTFVVDAGLDAVGIGGAAASGFKLNVTGAAKIGGVRSADLITINDDNATSLTPANTLGAIMIVSDNTTASGTIIYNTGIPGIIANLVGSNTNVTTGVLAGTTGTDTKFTVSCHTDGKLYFENRLGSSLSFYLLLI